MSDDKIWYEPHPVTPERKAELRAQGFRILDAVFQPEGHENPGEGGCAGGADSNGDGKVTAAEIKASLTAAGVPFKGNASKGDLQALLAAFERSGLSGADWNNLADEDRAARIAQ